MVQLMPLHPKTLSSLDSFKSRLLLPFWYRLTLVVLEKRLLNWCNGSNSSSEFSFLLQPTMWHCPHSLLHAVAAECWAAIDRYLLSAGPAAATGEWEQTDACQLHRFCSEYYAASANNSAVVTDALVEESDVLPDLNSLFSRSETILGDIPSTSAELKDTQEQVSSKCVQKKLLLLSPVSPHLSRIHCVRLSQTTWRIRYCTGEMLLKCEMLYL